MQNLPSALIDRVQRHFRLLPPDLSASLLMLLAMFVFTATGVLVRMPAGVGQLIKEKNPQNWGFTTEPEPHLDNRRLYWPRGRGLGGNKRLPDLGEALA